MPPASASASLPDPVVGASRRGWSIERILLLLTFVTSLLGFTFGLGVQWAKTVTLESNQQALAQQVKANAELIEGKYVPREVYAADQRRLTEAIDRLTRTLDGLTVRALRSAPGTP